MSFSLLSFCCHCENAAHQAATVGFPGGSVDKNPPANARDTRDLGSIPGPRRSPAGGNGNPLHYFCLENPMDRRAWWATYRPWGRRVGQD